MKGIGDFSSEEKCLEAAVDALKKERRKLTVVAWGDGSFSWYIGERKENLPLMDYRSETIGEVVKSIPIKPGSV